MNSVDWIILTKDGDELQQHGEHRQRLGYAAYHWGIVISPKNTTGRDCYGYDVSDGAVPDPQTLTDRNPNRNWHFRTSVNVNPRLGSHLLAMVMIGKAPQEITYSEIEIRLQSIPVPQKDVVPEQNCVNWVMNAIRTLQDIGLADRFDLNEFMVYALSYADKRMSQTATTSDIVNFTSRPM